MLAFIRKKEREKKNKMEIDIYLFVCEISKLSLVVLDKNSNTKKRDKKALPKVNRRISRDLQMQIYKLLKI